MTVKELLRAMAGAYKNFDAEAVAAVAMAFRQKLVKFEGSELAGAWTEIVSGFSPTARQPFPLPKDFEAVLPQPARVKAGPALDRKGHAERKASLMADWQDRQGDEIEAAYGKRVRFWCYLTARDRAQFLAWAPDGPEGIWLKQSDIDKVIQSLTSRDRLEVFGQWSARETGEGWARQMEECREHVLAGRYSYDAVAAPVQNMRKGPPAGPVVDLGADAWTEIPEGDEAQAEP